MTKTSDPVLAKRFNEGSRDQRLARVRLWLHEQMQALKEAFLASGNADIYTAAHARIIDELIATLAASYDALPVSIVAVGGYGRSELFPYSDLDLLFLYDKQEAKAAEIAEFILYFLWDLGLTVGQAHRTVEDTILLAGQDITIRTNLLDARLVAGDAAIFGEFKTRFEKDVMAGTVADYIDTKLKERDTRHKRFGDSRYMLEPNVKEGKGGLRDVHTLWWLARYAYGVEAFGDLVSKNVLTPQEFALFDQARQFLCRARCFLHYQAGRAEERLTFDRQLALAVAMGFAHPSVNRAIERFMRRYFVAVRTVGATTRIFCALLEDEKKRPPRKSFAWLQMPWKLGGFKLEGERLTVKNEHVFEQHPIAMLEMFKVSQESGIDIHPRALQLMARNLKRIDDKLRHDPEANAVFLDILLSKKDMEATLRRMSEAGVMGKFIPDFGRVIGQTQFNMYHVYTVDEHTLVALGVLRALEEGTLQEIAPVATEVIKRITLRRVLYLALLCHDIAKGRGTDHSELGEKLATKLATRMGFSQDEVETTAWLVRHHLLFTTTAFKRDADDPQTVVSFVSEVRSSERLKLLFVLTVADMRAVSPNVWNSWKASLLRDLYNRAEQLIGTGQRSLKRTQTEQFRQELLKMLPGWGLSEIDHYIEQCPPGFLTNCSMSRHVLIARMLRQAEHMPLPLLVDTQHDYERMCTEITVCTLDQHGLFSKLAGAMALAGANIITAKIFTLKNGMAVDIFQVQDATGDVFDRADRLAKLSVYIEQALSGELDLLSAFAEKRSAYGNPSHRAVPVPGQIFIENDASNPATIIELAGFDRTGFLYEVTRAIAELGLSIITAHISTYGTQVADVFYVKDIFGMKIDHDKKKRQIREALLPVINNQAPVSQTAR